MLLLFPPLILSHIHKQTNSPSLMDQDLEEHLCLAGLPVAFCSKCSLANTLAGFLDTPLEKVTEFHQPVQLNRKLGITCQVLLLQLTLSGPLSRTL